MGSKPLLILPVVAVVLAAISAPDEAKLQTAFMERAYARFFELGPEHQKIYENLRADTLRGKHSPRTRYKNFLLFSSLSYETAPHARTSQSRVPLALGAYGIAVPLPL